MPRLKEFDPEAALSAAVEVFWEKGYEKTSLDDLQSRMGIARQSIYDTFGDKRALYLKALDRYRRETQAELRNIFTSRATIHDSFAEVLNGIVSESRKQHQRGCLLLSANLERDKSDKNIARLVQQNQDEVTSIFEEALRKGLRRGELPPNKEPAALARFFVMTIQGMRLSARVDSNRETLAQLASMSLSVLD